MEKGSSGSEEEVAEVGMPDANGAQHILK